jgi:hypothetical protein
MLLFYLLSFIPIIVNEICENKENKKTFLKEISKTSSEDCSNYSKKDILHKINNNYLKNKPLTINQISGKFPND